MQSEKASCTFNYPLNVQISYLYPSPKCLFSTFKFQKLLCKWKLDATALITSCPWSLELQLVLSRCYYVKLRSFQRSQVAAKYMWETWNQLDPPLSSGGGGGDNIYEAFLQIHITQLAASLLFISLWPTPIIDGAGRVTERRGVWLCGGLPSIWYNKLDANCSGFSRCLQIRVSEWKLTTIFPIWSQSGRVQQ